ncbi:MAG: hypothetical protein ACI4FZ_01290 [Lachnospiraceae bacterium]
MITKQKNDHGKKPWLPLCLLSFFFYGVMLLLTITAKDIHNARLPEVTAGQPGRQNFTCTVTAEDGTRREVTRSYTALPKDMVDSGKVFTLRSVVEGDFTYYYAEALSITVNTAMENSDYYAVSDNSIFWNSVILTGYEALSDGDEVFLIKESQKKPEELNKEDLFQ